MNEETKFNEAWPAIHSEGFGKGWRGVGWAAWQAAIASQAPRQALSDAEIEAIGADVGMDCVEHKQHRDNSYSRMTTSEKEEFDKMITFARAIEAASGPNAALVEALKEMCDLVRLEVADGEHTTEFLRACAALAAVGVEP